MDMTIGQLAAAGGVGVETIRYYQRRGLLAEPKRGPMGEIRRYGENSLRRLRFIRAAQAGGFTLDEVAQLLDLHAEDDRTRARMLAERRIEALDAKIAGLVRARASLALLAHSCASSTTGPCPILEAFESC